MPFEPPASAAALVAMSGVESEKAEARCVKLVCWLQSILSKKAIHNANTKPLEHIKILPVSQNTRHERSFDRQHGVPGAAATSFSGWPSTARCSSSPSSASAARTRSPATTPGSRRRASSAGCPGGSPEMGNRHHSSCETDQSQSCAAVDVGIDAEMDFDWRTRGREATGGNPACRLKNQ